MGRRFLEPQATFQDAGSAAGVDQPAGFQRMRLAVTPIADCVSRTTRSDPNLAGLSLIDEVDLLCQAALRQEVLKTSAIQLITRSRRESCPTEFEPRLDPRIVTSRKKEPQTEFGKLFVKNVFFELEHFRKVVGRNFHGRLADFESGLGDGMPVLL